MTSSVFTGECPHRYGWERSGDAKTITSLNTSLSDITTSTRMKIAFSINIIAINNNNSNQNSSNQYE